jgi:hypothetical protein
MVTAGLFFESVPDHRFFVIGALYFLDDVTGAAVVSEQKPGINRGLSAFRAEWRFGYNTAPLQRTTAYVLLRAGRLEPTDTDGIPPGHAPKPGKNRYATD